MLKNINDVANEQAAGFLRANINEYAEVPKDYLQQKKLAELNNIEVRVVKVENGY